LSWAGLPGKEYQLENGTKVNIGSSQHFIHHAALANRIRSSAVFEMLETEVVGKKISTVDRLKKTYDDHLCQRLVRKG
jgi:hypothetical protein